MIPARRNWFTLVFLGVWLAGWTAGGVTAMHGLLETGQWFLALWLVGWAVGWVFAAATILWQLAGREVIAVTGGDLSLHLRAGRVSRTRHFRGSEIKRLRVVAADVLVNGPSGAMPFGRPGALKFDHGARTVGFAGGIDEAEAVLVRDWLLARLPRSAASPA